MCISPVSLWTLGRNRREGPPQQNVEGSRHQWALAAAFSPGSLPQRAVATRRRAQKRAATYLVPMPGANCQYENVPAPRLHLCGLQHPTETRHKLQHHLLLPGEQRTHLPLVSVLAAILSGIDRRRSSTRGFTHAPRDHRRSKNTLPAVCRSYGLRAWRNERLVHRKPIGVDGAQRFYPGSDRA